MRVVMTCTYTFACCIVVDTGTKLLDWALTFTAEWTVGPPCRAVLAHPQKGYRCPTFTIHHDMSCPACGGGLSCTLYDTVAGEGGKYIVFCLDPADCIANSGPP